MKLALGTVQFGLDYGVAKGNKKVSPAVVKDILDFSKNIGIDTLDTAADYGDSESILGDIGVDYYKVITKLPIIDNNLSKSENIFFDSLKNLKQKKIYGLLIHNIDSITSQNFDVFFKTINSLKSQGLVEKIGFSVYTSSQIDYLLNNFDFDLIQVPFNILDQRLLHGGQLSKLKENGIEIHARSAFLQGLLLMPFNDIPLWFNPILDVLEMFHLEAKKSNMSPLQLALSFVQSVKEIDKVVVGVNTLEQLDEVFKAESIRVNTVEFFNCLINDPTFLNPSNWKV
jgi:aryl-alcohol dehydrogenase-like predicted oxidoreductase